MAFTGTSIEIIALIVIIIAVIKMIVLLVNPMTWMNFSKKLLGKKGLAQIVALILAGIVLYFLIQGGMTIVEILAVMAFLSLLLVIGLAAHVEDLLAKYEALIKRGGNIWKENWLYTLVWIVLLVGGVVVLFF